MSEPQGPAPQAKVDIREMIWVCNHVAQRIDNLQAAWFLNGVDVSEDRTRESYVLRKIATDILNMIDLHRDEFRALFTRLRSRGPRNGR